MEAVMDLIEIKSKIIGRPGIVVWRRGEMHTFSLSQNEKITGLLSELSVNGTRI
jgi:hypothetical protein